MIEAKESKEDSNPKRYDGEELRLEIVQSYVEESQSFKVATFENKDELPQMLQVHNNVFLED